MIKSFEVYEFHFVICIAMHKFKLFLQKHGNIKLNSIPEINAFSVEIINLNKNKSEPFEVFVKIKPTDWPKKCYLLIRLKNLTGNWVADTLSFYYPEVIDRLIKFDFTNNTIVPSRELDEKTIKLFIKPELIN